MLLNIYLNYISKCHGGWITVKCKFFKNRKDGGSLKNLLGEENISFFLPYSLRHKYRRFEGETFDRKGYKTGRICSIWDSQLHTFLRQKVLGEFCGVLYFSGLWGPLLSRGEKQLFKGSSGSSVLKELKRAES